MNCGLKCIAHDFFVPAVYRSTQNDHDIGAEALIDSPFQRLTLEDLNVNTIDKVEVNNRNVLHNNFIMNKHKLNLA